MQGLPVPFSLSLPLSVVERPPSRTNVVQIHSYPQLVLTSVEPPLKHPTFPSISILSMLWWHKLEVCCIECQALYLLCVSTLDTAIGQHVCWMSRANAYGSIFEMTCPALNHARVWARQTGHYSYILKNNILHVSLTAQSYVPTAPASNVEVVCCILLWAHLPEGFS